jgi:hypothetical protein
VRGNVNSLLISSLYSELLVNEKSVLVLEAIARFGGFLVCLSDPDNPIWREQQDMGEVNSDASPFFRSDIHSIEPPGFEVLDRTKLKNTVLWFPVSFLFIYYYLLLLLLYFLFFLIFITNTY